MRPWHLVFSDGRTDSEELFSFSRLLGALTWLDDMFYINLLFIMTMNM